MAFVGPFHLHVSVVSASCATSVLLLLWIRSRRLLSTLSSFLARRIMLLSRLGLQQL